MSLDVRKQKYAKIDSLTCANKLETQSNEINRNLEATVSSLPAAANLSGISHANDILAIAGGAPSEKEFVLYLKNLDTSDGFGDVTSANVTRTGNGWVDFTLLSSSAEQSNGARVIEIAISKLPASVNMTSTGYADGRLTMTGWSPDEAEVLSYLRDLQASGEFSEIIIARMMKIEDGGMDFALILKTPILKLGE